MPADDSMYITPHEAALGVVATAMKKARLRLDILILNSILGGMQFSSGGFLYVGFHAENPVLLENNPGIANFVGAAFFGIGLFYVVIMGADLFNSNILFFSVAFFRGAVTIYDVAISWFVSLLGNIAGNLFMAYVFLYLSGSGATKNWSEGSRKVLEDKASFTFIQTFLKGIAGNFYVCLAVYLQLMAKPIHVKYIIMTLPIFTFVALGFTHSVADMAVASIGMLNGADVSVGKYIWKLLIPGSIGNIIGGSAFGFLVPFILHLKVVEMDRAKLDIPVYEARDEQPELNTDSRVVRIPQSELESEENNINYLKESIDSSCSQGGLNNPNNIVSMYSPSSASVETPRSFISNKEFLRLSRNNTANSNRSNFTISSRQRSLPRSPPGVFPVRGMGLPLPKERIIENGSNYELIDDVVLRRTDTAHSRYSFDNNSTRLRKSQKMTNSEAEVYSNPENYDVAYNKPGAILERVVRKLTNTLKGSDNDMILPKTTQTPFPHNDHRIQRTYSGTPSQEYHPQAANGNESMDSFMTTEESLNVD